MPGMLYQIMNKERKLMEITKLKNELTRKQARKQKHLKPIKTAETETVEMVETETMETETLPNTSPRDTQTIGLHKVPISLVDELKAEAKRRSTKGKRVTITDIALDCFQIGLAEMTKQNTWRVR